MVRAPECYNIREPAYYGRKAELAQVPAETYPYWVEVVKDPEPDNGHPLLARKGMFGLIIRAWVGDPNYVMRSCLWVNKNQIKPLEIRRERNDDRTWCDRIAESQEKLLKYLDVID